MAWVTRVEVLAPSHPKSVGNQVASGAVTSRTFGVHMGYQFTRWPARIDSNTRVVRVN